ncbi:MAG: antibiotic biosynthesis monooxygenase [Paracoccaceae bacterium]
MPKVYLDGLLVAETAAQRAVVDLYLDEHILLTRAEPGCLKFEVTKDEKRAGYYHVSEIFQSEEDFDFHQNRAKDSEWGQVSTPLERRFKKRVE